MNLPKVIHDIHTTHTFGAIRGTGDQQKFLYKEIFFNDKSFLCNKEQTKKYSNGISRNMANARAFNLDEFVFAYLGAHELYYSKNNGKIVPPFGIFFTKKLDNEKLTRVSRYDLASNLSTDKNKNTFYNSPQEARIDAVDHIKKDFKGNFFSYWINTNYEVDFTLNENSWEWKFEFHYHEKVDLSNVDAVLWPVLYIAKTDNFSNATIWKKDEEYEQYREIFTQQYKHVRVYPFYFDVEKADEMFIYASYIITKYYSDYFCYPDKDFFIQKYSQRFSIYD